MSMTAKDFVALANQLRPVKGDIPQHVLDRIIGFCRGQNPRFSTHTFVSYLNGKCDPRGGKLKGEKEPDTTCPSPEVTQFHRDLAASVLGGPNDNKETSNGV